MIAAQRRRVREKKVRDEHWLRRAQMRERGHDGAAGRLGLRGERRDDRRDGALQQWNSAEQVQT